MVRISRLLAVLVALAPLPAFAQGNDPLTVTVAGLGVDGRLADTSAACLAQGKGSNQNPAVSWSAGPAGTRSYALTVIDPDVPVEKTDAAIPSTAPRKTVYHWVLADIPASRTAIAIGEEPDTLPGGPSPVGLRGAATSDLVVPLNEDASVFGGWHGPCPPAGDMKIHRYRFQVYALDIERIGLEGRFTGEDLAAAINGHVLAMGEAVGSYSLNAAAR